MVNLGTLRDIQDEELQLMLKWRNNPAVRVNMYTRHEISLAEHIGWWERIKTQSNQQYLMYEYEGVARGVVGLTNIDYHNANCCWAFYADPEAPKGVGSRMEYLVLERVFGEIKLHKLYCEVLAFNAPVVKLHQKFGFEIEGIFRQQHKHENTMVDIVRLGIFASEWAAKKDEMLARLAGRVEKK